MANPFVHAEFATNDLAKAKAFYKDLFDWKLDDNLMPDYTFIDVGDNEYGVGGGILQAPMPGMPSAWLAYVGSTTSPQPHRKRSS